MYDAGMCWTATASLALGAVGLGTAAYLEHKKEPRGFTIPLAFFSLMEFLQFFSYASIDECAMTSNTMLTLLSYIHIAFQPIFINLFLMYMQERKGNVIPQRTKWLAYGASILITVIMLIRLVPFVPDSLCTEGQTICGPVMCTVSGAWHLAWSVPYYTVPFPGDGMWYYGFASFLIPILLYGAWSGVALAVITGPVLAYILTAGGPLEWPAVWCLFSVGMILSLLVWRWFEKVPKKIT